MKYSKNFLSGVSKSDKRYKMEVGFGYGIAFVISLLTVIVEFGVDKCSPIRTRFGDEKCFFSGEDFFVMIL